MPESLANVLSENCSLELDGIDRMYLNVYQPRLQRPEQVAWYIKNQLGQRFPSTVLLEPLGTGFVKKAEAFARREGIPVVRFAKGMRKDEMTQKYLAENGDQEGVLYIGIAQEKAKVVRTERRKGRNGRTYPWLVSSTAMVNHVYFYCVDKDFGPFFLKFCTYFPFNGKLCLNGHEWLKRQLKAQKIRFEALDNGIASCADPEKMQALADRLGAEDIDRLLRKWLRKLPHPFPAQDRASGYLYDLSILQAEFSTTCVLKRPANGRAFFESVVRDHIGLGRPDQVQLIFDRRVTRRTPGRMRTRVISEGVVPSLHVDYKKSKIKQYHKEGRALRTETTINDTHDFGVGRRLKNLPELRRVGLQANHRLLAMQKTSRSALLKEDAFARLNGPVEVEGQRASGLRFGEARAQTLLAALALFRFQVNGFRSREMREVLAQLGMGAGKLSPGRMTYDLRRLRLHGMIARKKGTHRYEVTEYGWIAAAFYTKLKESWLTPGLAEMLAQTRAAQPSSAPELFRKMTHWFQATKEAA
jgi:hypothetical protein